MDWKNCKIQNDIESVKNIVTELSGTGLMELESPLGAGSLIVTFKRISYIISVH